jgi:hypothetical protein
MKWSTNELENLNALYVKINEWGEGDEAEYFQLYQNLSFTLLHPMQTHSGRKI